MSILSWNCRGLGRSSTVRELQCLIKTQNPSMVFLSETKIESKKFEKIRMDLQMFGLSIDAVGRKGGLAILWKKELDVCLQSFSTHFIDAIVQDTSGAWRFTGIYGHPEAHLRNKTWNLMRSIAARNLLPWICIGDFNEILYHWECRGGRRRPSSQMNLFKKTVRDCDLNDLPTSGYPFTWAKNWKRTNSYRARLDRALVNSKFHLTRNHLKIFHLDVNSSDHLPILMPLDKQKSLRSSIQRKAKRFRFESMWVKKPEVRQVIETAWNQNTSAIPNKLEACKKDLVGWKRSFGNIFHEADKLRDQIAELKFDMNWNDQESEEIGRLQKELEERLDQQEKLWQQRSRALWLKNGDKNTSYFHQVASRRQKSNQITGLRDDTGRWVENPDDLHMMIKEYFKRLFTTEVQENEQMQWAICRMNSRVSGTDFAMLSRQFSREEVQKALFEMHPLKSPGPDGFNPQFFQEYWDIIGPDVTSYILQMLRSTQIPPEGIKTGKEGPRINHLMFADDTILFGVASTDEANAFAEILRLYTSFSGQKELEKHEKYPGLPTITGHSKKQFFMNIRNKIVGRLNGWEEKLLSRAGKETLIKSVIQSLPTYDMSVFKLPDALIDDIHSEIANFWWGKKDNKKSIHWIAWHNLCRSKDLGGLGLKDLKSFNIALLSKQVWKLVTDEDSLLAQIYKNLYYRDTGFMEAKVKTNASFSWRSIMWARDQIKEGFMWHIGNGSKTEQNEKVQWLIDKNRKSWKEELLEFFSDEEANAIRQIPLGDLTEDDILCWPYTKNGCYSVKSGYHFVQKKRMEQLNQTSTSDPTNTNSRMALWKTLWSLKVPPKVKIFCWRLCLNALPSYENLRKK